MAERQAESHSGENTGRHHEPDSIWTGSIATVGVGLLLLVTLALIGIATAFRVLLPDLPAIGAGDAWTRQHQAPGVEPNQAYDRQRILAEEQAYLKQYAWQNKEAGIARIPIERGMEIMAERGLNVEWPSRDSTRQADGEAK